MKWKQRKSKSRLHAQQRKANRGRHSNTTRRQSKSQEEILGNGYTKMFDLFKRLWS